MASDTQSAGGGASTGSGAVWSNPGNIIASDDSRAVATLDMMNTSSQNLEATSFSFSIVGTIDGIEVKIERSGSISFAAVDSSVQLLKAGVPTGADKFDVISWPTADTVAVYGGASDLWDTTWTAAQINASNFGVKMAASWGGFDGDARVDHIEIIVYFTATDGTPHWQRRRFPRPGSPDPGDPGGVDAAIGIANRIANGRLLLLLQSIATLTFAPPPIAAVASAAQIGFDIAAINTLSPLAAASALPPSIGSFSLNVGAGLFSAAAEMAPLTVLPGITIGPNPAAAASEFGGSIVGITLTAQQSPLAGVAASLPAVLSVGVSGFVLAPLAAVTGLTALGLSIGAEIFLEPTSSAVAVITPTITVGADLQTTPIAGVAGIPTGNISVGVSGFILAPLAAVAGLTASSLSIGAEVLQAPTSSAVAVITPTITVGADLQTTPIAAIAGIPDGSISAGITGFILAPLAAVAGLTASGLSIGAEVLHAPTSSAVAVITPTITVGADLQSAPIAAIASIPDGNISAGISEFILAPLAAVAGLTASGLSIGAEVLHAPTSSAVAVITPTITVGADLQPTPIAAQAASLAGSISVGVSGFVLAPLAAVAGLTALDLSIGAEVLHAPTSSAVSVIRPTITVGADVQPPPMAAIAGIASGLISVGISGFSPPPHAAVVGLTPLSAMGAIHLWPPDIIYVMPPELAIYKMPPELAVYELPPELAIYRVRKEAQ